MMAPLHEGRAKCINVQKLLLFIDIIMAAEGSGPLSVHGWVLRDIWQSFSISVLNKGQSAAVSFSIPSQNGA